MGGVATDGLKHALEAERRIEPGGNVSAAWEALLKDARNCTRCDLYKFGTQTVFGEGPLDASIMFVGEQPGDQEDLAGRPFVGPAGALFDAALENMAHSLCVYDEDWRVVVRNRRYLELYGLAADDAQPGTPLLELMRQSIDRGMHSAKSAESAE